MLARRSVRSGYNKVRLGSRLKITGEAFPHVIARHSSLLFRKLGQTDRRLQENKIVNLRQAIRKLDGLVIPPGKIFSLWHQVGKPLEADGYVSGMVLSNGKVSEDIGGGLCQLSNFLFWIFLHADIKIVERYHHSVDVFPDEGRVLPFGSGATIFYNYLDLKIQNISAQPLQLKVWLTDSQLKGQLLCPQPEQRKFHIIEKDHCFIKHGEEYFRFNEIWRQTLVEGSVVAEEKIVTNFAPVVYPVDEQYLRERQYRVLT
jgi:vancomycin resistance protein VanW